jgi:uncharacterized protein GlcG (DUF336 family)
VASIYVTNTKRLTNEGAKKIMATALGLALAAGPERWTAMEGGCPIIGDGECTGGVGIADGDWATDARISQQAVEAIGASYGG